MKRVSRLFAFLLALCILAGLCPIPPAEAAPTSEQQATAEDLKAKIEAIIRDDRYSKYVQYLLTAWQNYGKYIV